MWRILVVVLSLIAGLAFRGPSNTRHDIWVEPKGSSYVTCHRVGSFDPAVQFALFRAPVMIRQALRQPLPECSGDGVRFVRARTPEQLQVERREVMRDIAGLALTVCFAATLVSLCNSIRRRLKCRNQ